MNDFGTIFACELRRRVRTRLFAIGLIGSVLFALLIANVPTLFGNAARSSNSIVLVGTTDLTAAAGRVLGREYNVVASDGTRPARIDEAYLRARHDAVAAVELHANGKALAVTVHSRNLASFGGRSLERDLAPLATAVALGDASGRLAIATVPVRTVDVGGSFGSTARADAANSVGTILSFVLYLLIIASSQIVLSSVVEEKTNRIAEILVSTTRASTLLSAKVCAVGTAAVIQLAVLVAAFAIAAHPSAAQMAAARARDVPMFDFAIEPAQALAFATFFVLGFFQFASIFAAAGSLVSRTEDVSAISLPIVMPIVLAFMIAQFALISPASPVVVAASFVPLFSPFVMFVRMAISSVPAWQVALAVAIDAVALLAIVGVSGKLYRAGLLLYGKPPSFAQIAAIVRAR